MKHLLQGDKCEAHIFIRYVYFDELICSRVHCGNVSILNFISQDYFFVKIAIMYILNNY